MMKKSISILIVLSSFFARVDAQIFMQLPYNFPNIYTTACLPENCVSVGYMSPAFYSQDFYQQQNEEADYLANWFSPAPSTFPPYVESAFYSFYYYWFQPPAAFAPTTVTLKIAYHPPMAPSFGSGGGGPGFGGYHAPIFIQNTDKTFVISN